MVQIKSTKTDLRGKYKRFFEISLIVSLTLIIVAFKYFPHIKSGKVVIQAPQELIKFEDIQSTKQQEKLPPPPKPVIPIETPTEDVFNDIVLTNNEIDDNANIPLPPPNNVKNIDNEDHYFIVVEEEPEPIGGIAAIRQKVIYPEIAQRAGIEGTVVVKAYVDEKGIVRKAEIFKSLGAGCDEAALNAVMETKFIPGKQRGKPVKVIVAVPVVFKLK